VVSIPLLAWVLAARPTVGATLVMTAVVIASSFALVWLTAGQLQRLLGRLTQTARRLTADASGERFALDGTEVDAAATALNSAVERFEELSERDRDRINLLESSNEELVEFAAVAAHDLQEPLRKIIGFAELLAARPNQLDEESQLYLDRITASTNQMSALVTDLLELSRIESGGRPFVRIRLAEVLEKVVADLDDRIQESGSKIEMASLPVVRGDPIQLERLFVNLVGNAIKFRKPGGGHKVSITASSNELAALVTVTVLDNGIGFEPSAAERIFQPFERLHGRQYDGTGMGLAICRRIVQRHGGTITADGRPGEGARVMLTLAAAGPDQR
jgi:signal transduction histidine kinase